MPAEIRLSQRRAPHAGERGAAVAHVRRACLEQIGLEPAIARADDGEIGISGLELRGQTEMAIDADQGMLGGLVTVHRRVFERADEVRAGVRVPHRHVDQRDP